jgi:hypothetical protein
MQITSLLQVANRLTLEAHDKINEMLKYLTSQIDAEIIREIWSFRSNARPGWIV